MGQEQAQRDLVRPREVVVRDLPGSQVGVDVRVEVESAPLDEMEDRRSHQGLRGRGSLEQGPGGHRHATAGLEDPVALRPLEPGAVDDGDADARDMVERHAFRQRRLLRRLLPGRIGRSPVEGRQPVLDAARSLLRPGRPFVRRPGQERRGRRERADDGNDCRQPGAARHPGPPSSTPWHSVEPLKAASRPDRSLDRPRGRPSEGPSPGSSGPTRKDVGSARARFSAGGRRRPVRERRRRTRRSGSGQRGHRGPVSRASDLMRGSEGGAMNFRAMAVITAIVTLLLGAGYLFAGALVIGRWQIEPSDGVLLLGRRMGALYLGLSVMFFLARSAPASVGRTALSVGAAVVCSLLALLGIYEFAAGRAGAGILASVAIEALLALGYGWVLAAGRRAALAVGGALLLGALFAATPAPVRAAEGPVRVEVVPQGGGWRLLRGGEPYVIKGAGGDGSLELLAASGANSIRTWGADSLGPAARPGASAGAHGDRGLLARARAARLRLRGSRAGGRAVRARARGHPALQGPSRGARVGARQRDGRIRRRRQPRHLGGGREPCRPRPPPRSRASDHDRDRRHRRQAGGVRAPALPGHRHHGHQQLRGRLVAARALPQGGRHQALRRDRVRSAGHLGDRAQCVGRGRGVVEHAQGRLLPRHLRAAGGGLGGLPGFVRVHLGRQAGGDRDVVRHAAARRHAAGRRRRDGRAVVGTRAGESLPGDRFARARGPGRGGAGRHGAGEARGRAIPKATRSPSSGRSGPTRSPTRPAETSGRRRAATASRS